MFVRYLDVATVGLKKSGDTDLLSNLKGVMRIPNDSRWPGEPTSDCRLIARLSAYGQSRQSGVLSAQPSVPNSRRAEWPPQVLASSDFDPVSIPAHPAVVRQSLVPPKILLLHISGVYAGSHLYSY